MYSLMGVNLIYRARFIPFIPLIVLQLYFWLSLLIITALKCGIVFQKFQYHPAVNQVIA